MEQPEQSVVPPIKLGSQYMVSCYFAPVDYGVLKSYSTEKLGKRKMASLIRQAVKEYFDKRGVQFEGTDPKLFKAHES